MRNIKNSPDTLNKMHLYAWAEFTFLSLNKTSHAFDSLLPNQKGYFSLSHRITECGNHNMNQITEIVWLLPPLLKFKAFTVKYDFAHWLLKHILSM